MKKKSWYPIEDKKCVIEINVESFEQLFDKRDPNPYRSKDLDDDIFEYILSCSEEIGLSRLGKLRIIFKEQLTGDLKVNGVMAIHEFFHYRMDICEKKIKTIFKLGFKTLMIGLVFLSISVFFSYSISKTIENDMLKSFLKEGFLLLGWVSMWKPINIFLYEWWPLTARRKLFDKLSDIKIEFIVRE
ncbi:MAG: hypothetical protein GY909_03865 [Oligoflexia bacterium]|nr:hypothetical protein [Oligoflexia bacterium]